jgi:hypothetical protein
MNRAPETGAQILGSCTRALQPNALEAKLLNLVLPAPPAASGDGGESFLPSGE